MRTVSGADQIVVLKDGTVAEQDLPAELLQLGGIFARMVSSCPIVIFQCRDNRNDSDPSPFVHLVVHTTILEIKRRNPNPSPIGMMFGFLGYGGATAVKVELSGESAESISSGMSGKATCDFSPLIL